MEQTRPSSPPRSLPRGGNTAWAIQRIASRGELQPLSPWDAPYGRYRGRRVIGAASRIDGGVYLGRMAREAIVIDMARPGSLLRRVYDAFVAGLSGGTGRGRVPLATAALVPALRALVTAVMPYDEARVHLLEQRSLPADDSLVDLDLFLHLGYGVCRHQVCLVGAVLERLVDEGRLQGRVSLQRCFVEGWFSHAWIRWCGGDGVPWLFDPAQHRYCPLADVDPSVWLVYGRPGDFSGDLV
jgi:hypothetical protein